MVLDITQLRVLEEDADVDEDVAKLLDGTDSDPDKIREKVKEVCTIAAPAVQFLWTRVNMFC